MLRYFVFSILAHVVILGTFVFGPRFGSPNRAVIDPLEDFELLVEIDYSDPAWGFEPVAESVEEPVVSLADAVTSPLTVSPEPDEDALSTVQEEDEALPPPPVASIPDVETPDAVFDPTQDAALGSGVATQSNPILETESEQSDQDIEGPNITEDQAGAGGEADPLAQELAMLTETVVDDTAPAPEFTSNSADQDELESSMEALDDDSLVEANSPGEQQDVIDLTPEVGDETQTDAEAENAFATMPVPKMRPTRRPTYIDTEAPEDQDRLVSAARLVPDDPVEELIAAAMEQAAAEDARLAAEAAEIARVAAARQAEADAKQSARDAANASASRQINAGIADNMDWPIFIRAQDQWKFGATVTLKDLSGGIASVQVRILNAPASADSLQKRTVRDALERSIWASGPWPIPTEYYEDWLDIPEFVLCPPVNALTVSLAC